MTLMPKKLHLKIHAAIWCVSALLLLVFSVFYINYEQRRQNVRLKQVEILLTAVFEQNREELANVIFAGHLDALNQTLDAMLRVQGLRSVRIIDLQGRPLAQKGRFSANQRLPAWPTVPGQTPQFRIQDETLRPVLAFSAAIEAIGERVGYCAIDYDLREIKAASKHRVRLVICVLTAGLLTMSVLLNFLLTHWVTRPLSRVNQAIGILRKGQLGTQIEGISSDEIGDVAGAINEMSTQLKEQRERLLLSIAERKADAEQLATANKELATLNTNLEDMVETRTRELRVSYEKLQAEIKERKRASRAKNELEEQLSRSRKMEALGILAGGVAHDLNNVLSGIVSYPDIILMQVPEESPIRPMLETVQRSGQKAAAIVQDLLTLARRGVTNTEILNLNEAVVNAYLASPECGKLKSVHTQVTMETDLSEDILNVRGSAIHLRKVLMNLVSNAAEAQPDGGRIIIRSRNQYVDTPFSGYEKITEGDYVVLEVADYGVGIAGKDLDRIFEPFYTRKAMGRSGTGLGMAVVWGTVQDHKGYINVHSQPQEGTLFQLYLPVTREQLPHRKSSPAIDDYVGQGEKILVIDDIEEQQEIAAAMLTRLNYDVLTVSSGEAALAYLRGHEVEVLILDMVMDPGMDGLETYQRVLELNPRQKAIIASGFAENERVTQALTLGAGAYLRKPYSLEKIGLALRKVLTRPPGEKPAHGPVTI